MGGTLKGGLAASKTNKQRHGNDFYQLIGSKGGKILGLKKGYAAMDRAKVQASGHKGGSMSVRPCDPNSKRQIRLRKQAAAREALSQSQVQKAIRQRTN